MPTFSLSLSSLSLSVLEKEGNLKLKKTEKQSFKHHICWHNNNGWNNNKWSWNDALNLKSKLSALAVVDCPGTIAFMSRRVAWKIVIVFWWHDNLISTNYPPHIVSSQKTKTGKSTSKANWHNCVVFMPVWHKYQQQCQKCVHTYFWWSDCFYTQHYISQQKHLEMSRNQLTIYI